MLYYGLQLFMFGRSFFFKMSNPGTRKEKRGTRDLLKSTVMSKGKEGKKIGQVDGIGRNLRERLGAMIPCY